MMVNFEYGNKEALNFIHMMRKYNFDKAKIPIYNNSIQLIICNVCIYCKILSGEAGKWQKNKRLELKDSRDELIISVSGTDCIASVYWDVMWQKNERYRTGGEEK